MPLADAHMHLFAAGYPGRYGPFFPGGRELAAYEAFRGIHRIERALVVGYEKEPWAAGNNRYIARLARRHSWMSPLAFCPASAPPPARQIEKWWRMGFRGISLYASQDSEIADLRAWPQEALAALNKKRAIISLNVPAAQYPHLRPFLARLHDTRILASHFGLPKGRRHKGALSIRRKALEPILRQADLPHLGVKISAFYAYDDYPHSGTIPVVQALRRHFGESRLYWGSDFSPALDKVSFSQSIKAVQNVPWSAAQVRAVSHNNLSRILNRVS